MGNSAGVPALKLSMFNAIGIGLLVAALLLVWEGLSVMLHGEASFSQTFWFTMFSIVALAIFALAMLKAPDN